MFFVDPCPNEFDNSDVMPRLALGAQSTFCGLSFFRGHSRAKPAYCARRFRGRHLSGFGVIRIPCD